MRQRHAMRVGSSTPAQAVDPMTGVAMTRTYGLMTPFDTKMKVWHGPERLEGMEYATEHHLQRLAEVSLGKDSEGPVYRNWQGQATGMALSTSRHRRMCSKPMLLAAVVVAACCLRM